ncbi:DUF6461 domain-containing protein [Actinoplanes cyaneus]|uniref:DUF6461 domain-containing protein n=1 Tax=Actinoplanes cyaneus TaxID=52696 RepID=UPI0019440A54|nr:DUF6461 domain-containing protein [Actinoplanes cyaneus]
MVTAEDYRWFQRDDNELTLGFCLSFIKGLTAGEATGRLGNVELSDTTVREVPGGTLMLERYGALGTDSRISEPLSAGTDVVVVFDSEHSDAQLQWLHDGDLRLECDPYAVNWRSGSDPDALLGPMRELGFNFSAADEPDDPAWVYDEDAVLRAFALAEQVTGVKFPEELVPVEAPEDEPEDVWDGVSLPDDRMRAAGTSGADLAGTDLPLLRALFQAGDAVCQEIARWAEEWAFDEAEVAGRPHAEEVLAALRSGDDVPDLLIFQVSRHLDPRPMMPTREADGRLDRGSRHSLFLEMLHNRGNTHPLAAACDALAAAAALDAGRVHRLHADLRRTFPQLDTTGH